MLKPEQRQAFVEVRRLTAEKYPPTQTSSPPKHKDVLRVRRLYNGGRKRQMAKKLAQAKSVALKEQLGKGSISVLEKGHRES